MTWQTARPSPHGEEANVETFDPQSQSRVFVTPRHRDGAELQVVRGMKSLEASQMDEIVPFVRRHHL